MPWLQWTLIMSLWLRYQLSQWNTAERARRKCLERLLPLETEYNVDTALLERREISRTGTISVSSMD